MIEADRVDHCGHENNPAILDEQLKGDRAVGACLDFAQDDATARTPTSSIGRGTTPI